MIAGDLLGERARLTPERTALVVLHPGFDAAEVWRVIERERCTVVLGVPTIYKLLLDDPAFATADLTHVRELVSGGAPLPIYLIEAYRRRGVPLRQGYGLTEVGVSCFAMTVEEAAVQLGSIGKPLLFTEARLPRLLEQPRGDRRRPRRRRRISPRSWKGGSRATRCRRSGGRPTLSYYNGCGDTSKFDSYSNVKAQLNAGRGSTAVQLDYNFNDWSVYNLAGGDADGVGHFRAKNNTGVIQRNMLTTTCTGTGCCSGYGYSCQ